MWRGDVYKRQVQDLLYLAQVPDVIVDAGVCRAGLPQRVVPAAQDAGAASPLHVAGEGVAHDHHLVPAAGADLGEYRVKKGGPRLLGPHDLRDEDLSLIHIWGDSSRPSSPSTILGKAGPATARAPAGQFFTQARQEMQRPVSVLRGDVYKRQG